MDYVLRNKAVFKRNAEFVGDAALVGSSIAADNIYKEKKTHRHRREGPPARSDRGGKKQRNAENWALGLGIAASRARFCPPHADARRHAHVGQPARNISASAPCTFRRASIRRCCSFLTLTATRSRTSRAGSPSLSPIPPATPIVILSELKF